MAGVTFENLTADQVLAGHRMIFTTRTKSRTTRFCIVHQVSAHCLPTPAELLALFSDLDWDISGDADDDDAADADLARALATKILTWIGNNVTTGYLRPGLVEMPPVNGTKAWTAQWKEYTLDWLHAGESEFFAGPSNPGFKLLDRSGSSDEPVREAVPRLWVSKATLAEQVFDLVEAGGKEEVAEEEVAEEEVVEDQVAEEEVAEEEVVEDQVAEREVAEEELHGGMLREEEEADEQVGEQAEEQEAFELDSEEEEEEEEEEEGDVELLDQLLSLSNLARSGQQVCCAMPTPPATPEPATRKLQYSPPQYPILPPYPPQSPPPPHLLPADLNRPHTLRLAKMEKLLSQGWGTATEVKLLDRYTMRSLQASTDFMSRFFAGPPPALRWPSVDGA